MGRLFYEAYGRHQCERCDLVKAYEQAVNEYLQLRVEQREEEADKFYKEEIDPMVEKQIRDLKEVTI